MKYFALLPDWDETHVYVDEIPSNLKKTYQFKKGVSRLADWPEDIVFRFSDNRPEGMVLTDWVDNEFSLLLVSNRFKNVVEATGGGDLEYLPVAMADHRGAVVDQDYWLVNSLKLDSVMDRQKSVYDPVEDEETVHSIDKLVLAGDFLAVSPPLARVAEYPMIVFVREDLVDFLKAAAITGVRFRASEQYKTHDPDDD